MTELFKTYIHGIVSSEAKMAYRGKHSSLSQYSPPVGIPLDEVVEVIELAHFDAKAVTNFKASKTTPPTEMSDTIAGLLREFVCSIAALYHANPFQ